MKNGPGKLGLSVDLRLWATPRTIRIQGFAKGYATHPGRPAAFDLQYKEHAVQISISARHGHISASHSEVITEKVQKLAKYHDRITQVGVIVDLEHKDVLRVEVTVKVEHAAEFVSTDTASETLTALDGALKKIEQQLRKHKEIITNHHKPGHKSFSGEDT